MSKKNKLKLSSIFNIHLIFLFFLTIIIGLVSFGGGYCSMNSCRDIIFQYNMNNSSNDYNELLFSYDSFSGISPDSLRKSLEKEEIIVIDIRTYEEYVERRIDDVMLIDFYDTNFVSKINSLDKNLTYVLYCRTGNRTNQTLDLMKSLGFKNVYHLSGGIENWQKMGFDIISG